MVGKREGKNEERLFDLLNLTEFLKEV